MPTSTGTHPRSDTRETTPAARRGDALGAAATLAAAVARAPVALVSVAEGEQQVVRSAAGIPEPLGGRREVLHVRAFSRHVATIGAPLVIGDTRGHPLTRPLIVGEQPTVGAYLGVPILGSDGAVCGTLAVLDSRAHAWSPDDLEMLERVAAPLGAVVELERVRAVLAEQEATLSARTDELQQLLNATTELIFATDAEGRVTFANDVWQRTLGYTLEEIAHRHVTELIAPEQRVRFVDAARVLVRGKTVENMEVVLLAKDGRRVVCRGRGVPTMGARNGAPYCLGSRIVGQDVTHVYETEAQQARLLALLEATPDFVGTTAPDGRIAYLNPAGRRLLGIASDADLNEVRPSAFYTPAMTEQLVTEIIPTATRDGVWSGEGTVRSASGEEIPVSMAMVAQPSLTPGEPPYFSAVIRDLRERHRIEATLERERAFLVAVLESLTDGVIACDTTGALTIFNRAMQEFHGVSPRMGAETRPTLRRHLFDADGVRQLPDGESPLIRAQRGEEFRNLPLVVAAPGQPKRDILASGRPIRGSDGTILGAVAAMHEVTEQRRSQAELTRQRAFLISVLNTLSENVSVCDRDGRLVLFNRATLDTYGIPADGNLLPEEWSEVYSLRTPDGMPFPVDELPHVRALRTGGAVHDVAFVVAVPGRPPRTMVADADVMRGPDGEILGTVCAARDVTEERRTVAALHDQESRLRLIYNSASDLMFLLRVERDATTGAVVAYRCESVNQTYLAATQLSEDAVIGRTIEEILPLGAAAATRARYDEAVSTGRVLHYDETADLPIGRIVVETKLTPVLDDAGTCTHLLGTSRDVSARRAAEAALRESEVRFRGVLENLRAAALQLDTDGRVTFANDALLALVGATRDEVLGLNWFDHFVPSSSGVAPMYYAAMARGEVPAHFESEVVTRSGERRSVAWDNVVLHGTDGEIIGTASVGQDVTERKALEARLAALSEHDELTGLLNRRGFRRIAMHALKSASRTRRRDAVLYIDLDDFKPINDSYGHATGDDALRSVAEVLRATVRDADFAARLGGDELAIYVVGLREGEGELVAARLRANLAAHNRAAAEAGRPFAIEFSVGVAELEPDDDLDTLLARADAALYARKLARRG